LEPLETIFVAELAVPYCGPKNLGVPYIELPDAAIFHPQKRFFDGKYDGFRLVGPIFPGLGPPLPIRARRRVRTVADCPGFAADLISRKMGGRFDKGRE
jgi:hypothetical protein